MSPICPIDFAWHDAFDLFPSDTTSDAVLFLMPGLLHGIDNSRLLINLAELLSAG